LPRLSSKDRGWPRRRWLAPPFLFRFLFFGILPYSCMRAESSTSVPSPTAVSRVVSPVATAGSEMAARSARTAPQPVLSGPNEVRIVNPNDFSVAVELRSEHASRSLQVPPNGAASAFVANGHFDVFFQYSNEPDARYQGDPFSLMNEGVEIRIVRAVDGNYGVRRVR
jgi:hypothetical protein